MPPTPASTAQSQPLPSAPVQVGMRESFEPIKPPEKEIFDTTTPMVKPGSVTRFLTIDTRKYGVWLLPRLTARWPKISHMTFSGWMIGWTGGNTFLFVKTDHAVGLFEVYRETPEMTNKGREVFVFAEDPKIAQHQEEVLAIYRHAKTWGRQIGVQSIRNIGGASDLPPSRLRANAAAATDHGLKLEL